MHGNGSEDVDVESHTLLVTGNRYPYHLAPAPES